MKVLWITNTIFPDPSKEMGVSVPVYGGWMYGLAKKIAVTPGIHLAVATIYEGKEIKYYNLNNITYYMLPSKSNCYYQKKLEPYWSFVCNEFKPDVVHIHGTEYAHGLACMRACPSLGYVVSIQGLVGLCSRYYYAGISQWNILKKLTFRDVLRRDTIYHGKRGFEKRSINEINYIKGCHHIIGRTGWDRIHVETINPDVKYHHCNECLRDSFYESPKWDLDKTGRYSIFCSQAMYPIKGLHQVLYAVSLLMRKFPLIQLRVAGQDVTCYDSLSQKIRLSGYGKILRSIIKANKLEKVVTFIGPLKEEDIIQEYLKANVFICPSSIENSPNSVGEAQLLGVPTIGSFVGGIPDMIEHGETGLLYRFEEVEMLANRIEQIFSNETLARHLSLNGIKASEKRHDCLRNLNQTLSIYKEVIR